MLVYQPLIEELKSGTPPKKRKALAALQSSNADVVSALLPVILDADDQHLGRNIVKAGLIFVLALMLVATSSVHADDNPETPWPIVERCVPGPTQPPIEWSYPGPLLMSGYAGIHAMRADWETPRIVASFYKSQLGKPIDGGQLSPNQRWYAVPIGEIFTEVSFNRYWFASGVRVYSMVDDSFGNNPEWMRSTAEKVWVLITVFNNHIESARRIPP